MNQAEEITKGIISALTKELAIPAERAWQITIEATRVRGIMQIAELLLFLLLLYIIFKLCIKIYNYLITNISDSEFGSGMISSMSGLLGLGLAFLIANIVVVGIARILAPETTLIIDIIQKVVK